MGEAQRAKADVLKGSVAVAPAGTYQVIVLGGGISGLVTAWKLAQAGVKTLLIERDSRVGGVIATRQEDEWLMDTGPNSLGFKVGDPIHQMIEELGLKDEALTRPIRESDRYIWRGGMLRRVPTGPFQLLRRSAISRRTFTRAVGGIFRRHALPEGDISVGAYFSHSLGRPAVDQLLTPAIAGIYASDPFCLSMEAALPRLHAAARESRSLAGALRAMKKESAGQGEPKPVSGRILCSFKSGMKALPERLVKAITETGGDVALSCAVKSLSLTVEGGFQVTTSVGAVFEADEVVCTLPSAAAADVVELVAPESAKALGQIRYAPMIQVHVGVKEAEVDVAHQGFGFLATRDSGVRSLGMVWSDRMFEGRAPEGHRMFTVFLGGQLDPTIMKLSDGEVLDIALKDLRRVMKWQGEAPEIARITRWTAAIPILEVGHPGRIRQLVSHLPEGLTLSGNYVTGVSVPTCMQSGAELAQRIATKRQKATRPITEEHRAQ